MPPEPNNLADGIVYQTRPFDLCSLSAPRACGDDVLRKFMTGGPPVRGGGIVGNSVRLASEVESGDALG